MRQFFFKKRSIFSGCEPARPYVDCTLGLAGHSAGNRQAAGPQGHLIGFDRDPEALALAKRSWMKFAAS
jgi:16S rRNA (cytosine1402-N4)-methyltransferase